MAGLTIKLERQGQGLFAVLAGEITEEANLAPILDAKASQVTLDLSEVQRINSTGVREWINFVSALQKTGAHIVLERCSVPIVQQLNMIANFRGGGQVSSVYAPYFCSNCSAEHAQLVTLPTDKRPVLADTIACPTCQSAMEFDDLPEAYLSFMDV